MKKILSVMLALVLVLSIVPTGLFSIAASAATSGRTGNCTWTLDGTVLTISGNGNMANYTYSGAPWGTSTTKVVIQNGVTSIGDRAFANSTSLTNITIPDSVTSIGDRAFANSTSLTNITIPDSVTSIGVGAFASCTKLASITILNGVTSIGMQAFDSCKGLTSITIPDSVEQIDENAFGGCSNLTNVIIGSGLAYIGSWPFSYCSSLKSIEVSANNNCFSSTNGILFNKNKTTLVCYPAGKTATSYVIPDGVMKIGLFAFGQCSRLTDITIPNSVTIIDSQAFDSCTGLTSITIPDSVTTIEPGAFYRCSGLTEITIGNGVTSISIDAFDGCSNLKDVWYVGSEADKNKISIDYGNTALTNATWHYETEIPHGTTGDCTWTLCGTVLTISGNGKMANYDFESPSPWGTDITEVIIENGVTSIGDSAFAWCTNLQNIIIPNGVISIGSGAFVFTGLTDITIPNSVTNIGVGAFEFCRALKHISLSENITEISASAFTGCGFTNIIIPNNVTSIGSGAFDTCSLTNITIPNNVTSIGSNAFYYCQDLQTITIHSTLITIDVGAFSDCDKLTDVFYDGTKTDKNNISIASRNDDLLNATWHYSAGNFTATKGTLTGTLGFAYNTPIKYTAHEGATAYGVEVSRSAEDTNPVDIQFAMGEKNVVGISNISLYGITKEYTFKPYAIVNGKRIYAESFTSSYAEFLVSKKDHATNGVKVRNILDTYAAATGEVVYEGQVPNLESAPAGTWVAANTYSESGTGEYGLKSTNPVQGSLVEGKLRVNFNLPTNADNNGILVYKSGNEFNANDISNAFANVVFEAGDLRSIDITNIAFANIAEQYTFIPYEYDEEFQVYEFGKVSKVSFADFVAYALNKGNASQKAQAYGICKAYKAAYGKDLCKIVE